MLAEWLQLIASTINWRLSWQRLWALVPTRSWIITLIASFLHEAIRLERWSVTIASFDRCWKTIKYEGVPKNHQQTIEQNDYPQPFHSKVIFALRTIKKDVNLTKSGPKYYRVDLKNWQFDKTGFALLNFQNLTE